MSLHFQKRVSIFPGVMLNFSKSGMSATIGVPGASINFGGARGPVFNLGIPGSGIGTRVPLSPPHGVQSPPFQPSSRPAQEFPPRAKYQSTAKSIHSAAVEVLTSPSLADLRDLILTARRKRETIEGELCEAARAVEQADCTARSFREEREEQVRRVGRLEASWLRVFRKGKIASTRRAAVQALAREDEAKKDLDAATQKRVEIAAHVESLFLEADFVLNGAADAAWNAVHDAFKRLAASRKIWDITTTRDKQKGEERSSATRIIDRQETKLTVATLPVIHAQYEALRWHNKNGHDLYLYPGFLIAYSNDDRFAMLDLSEVKLEFRPVQFQETEPPPADAKRVGTAYTYSNKDGSPDRRYAHNPTIAILMYAEIHLISQSGLSEAFQFSAAEAVANFVDAVSSFRFASTT